MMLPVTKYSDAVRFLASRIKTMGQDMDTRRALEVLLDPKHAFVLDTLVVAPLFHPAVPDEGQLALITDAALSLALGHFMQEYAYQLQQAARRTAMQVADARTKACLDGFALAEQNSASGTAAASVCRAQKRARAARTRGAA